MRASWPLAALLGLAACRPADAPGPACPASDPCSPAARQGGACVARPLADGVACTSPLTGEVGTCDRGACAVDCAVGPQPAWRLVRRGVRDLALDASGQLTWLEQSNAGLRRVRASADGAVLGQDSAALASAPPSRSRERSAWSVAGERLGFALRPASPDGGDWSMHAFAPGGAEVARGVDGPAPGAGVAAWPFLADDHLLVTWQAVRPVPARCHPEAHGPIQVERWSAGLGRAFACPVGAEAESKLLGAALLPGRLVLARERYLDVGCEHPRSESLIEAYDLPGEALASAD